VAQATTTRTGADRRFHASRTACRTPAQNNPAGTGPRIFDKGSGPSDVHGSSSTSRVSQILPALVKASRAQIAIGIGRQADPAASNKGSSLGNKQRCSAMCPLGSLGARLVRNIADHQQRTPQVSDPQK
jgi:hypothetical protein